MKRFAGLASIVLLGCGPSGGNGTIDGNGGNGDGGGGTPDACMGLECQVDDCAGMGQPATTLTGVVYAPNGTLPLVGVDVYIPRDALPPIVDQVECTQCSADLPGSPITMTKSDATGAFTLTNVPSGANIPLVVSIGKWRRQVTISNVTACTAAPLTADDTRLPRTQSEGHIPKMALTTGEFDSLECLLRKLGIADSEITHDEGPGRVHLYRGNGVGQFDNGFGVSGGENLASAQTLWDTPATLAGYDILFLSCEGSQESQDSPKSQAQLNNVKAYADLGGRVFASHWHNVWIGGNYNEGDDIAPAVWDDIATWGEDGDPSTPLFIDEASNPKGTEFADWMVNVGGSATRGEIELVSNTGRVTALTLNMTRAERWVYSDNQDPQVFQFTTPEEAPAESRCGKVVFADMHVSGTSDIGSDYPDSCPGGANDLSMTPQEKALAYMFFDIASCTTSIE